METVIGGGGGVGYWVGGDCEEYDCGEYDCGEGDCGLGDCDWQGG